VVALARASADFGDLPTRNGWHPAVNNRDVAAWTDDYSNVLGALVRKKMAVDKFNSSWGAVHGRNR
jgi:hypothetical protein